MLVRTAGPCHAKSAQSPTDNGGFVLTFLMGIVLLLAGLWSIGMQSGSAGNVGPTSVFRGALSTADVSTLHGSE